MRKIKMTRRILILIIIIISIPIGNRVIYGTFNVFRYPNRVFFNGYRYDNVDDFVILKGDKKPKYEVSGILDKITGKRIYSNNKNFKGKNGTLVYLHIKDDKYLLLLCGGGA